MSSTKNISDFAKAQLAKYGWTEGISYFKEISENDFTTNENVIFSQGKVLEKMKMA